MRVSFCLVIVFWFAFLPGCKKESRNAPAASSLSLSIYTASEAGSRVNSILVSGQREAILVDSQLLTVEALNVVEMVRQSGKELKMIWISHNHPDHYIGLAVLQDNFPGVPIVASPAIASKIAETAAATFTQLKQLFGAQIPDRYVVPAAYSSNLEIEGNFWDVRNFENAESEVASAIYIPSLQTLLAGDLVYNDTHLWMVEKHPAEWKAVLDQLPALWPIRPIYPGHGPYRGSELLQENKTYIDAFITETQKPGTTQASLIDAMSRLYPLHGGLFLLQMSAQSYFPTNAERR